MSEERNKKREEKGKTRILGSGSLGMMTRKNKEKSAKTGQHTIEILSITDRKVVLF